MNAKLQSIFTRRSVRRYTDQEVTAETMRDLLEAAMAAPSAVAKDPWHFIVLRDRDVLNTLADGLPNGQMLREAPVGVVVCGDLDVAHGNLESYMIQDCSAAIENLLLAASMLGLGAVWLGVHPREDRLAHVRSMFDLPAHITPVSAIAIGWPDEQPAARTRYSDNKVHFDQW
jgi:nitroreductase